MKVLFVFFNFTLEKKVIDWWIWLKLMFHILKLWNSRMELIKNYEDGIGCFVGQDFSGFFKNLFFFLPFAQYVLGIFLGSSYLVVQLQFG